MIMCNEHANRLIIVLMIFFSCMTFCVAKEVYDPHIGVQSDIFCKSLYALGEECKAPEDLFFTIVVENMMPFVDTMLASQVDDCFSERAPPCPC